jgi:WD40 repeat protein
VERNVIPALAVSPSGSQLALGSIPIYDPRCGVDLFEMQAHRGIQTLRGLTGQVCRTTITRNGNWIAAITLDSQAGVWNVFTGELMLRIDVPEALFAAHADVRVTEDGQFLIIASGKAAQRWSIPQVGPNQSPRLVDTWPLNPAFTNRLVISPEGKLLLCRFETKSGKQYPLGLASIDSDPRRVRIYELVPSKPALLIAAHADLPEHVDAIVALPDATCFIADGVASKMPVLNLVVAYAAQSKDRLWELPLPENRLRGSINIDATGRVLCYCVNSNLYQLRSLPFQAQPDVPGGAKEWPAFANRVVFRFAEDGVRLGFPESASEFLTLSPGKKVPGNTSLFTPDGRYLIWGLEDGTVHVADMEKVRQAMTTVGFGWEKLE